ncbi:MAG: GNAT family N-acetyltransferase [Christensenellaceae bacterium]|jgi:GNAT superfamily N-acetyltransferase|nr:GNAT family N-acetyltransferase [Christensenellaceae bacterium]
MIVWMDKTNWRDYGRANEPFKLIGRLLPRFEAGCWTHEEELFALPREKRYPSEPVLGLAAYVDSPGRAVFFFYEAEQCLGQIRLRTNWNRFAFIEDLAVSAAFRGRGIGGALLCEAESWARQEGLLGLMLETQDDNLLACRFYLKCGFTLGGADRLLYSAFEEVRHETALFFYLRFCKEN